MKKKRNNSGKVRIREIKKPKIREIKNKEPEVKKEETLEEHVENSEIFESDELPEFVSSSALPSSQSTAPVLEKIQREEEADLESNVISTPLSREITQEGVATNYGASQNYFSSGYNEVNGNYSTEPMTLPAMERTNERVQRQELMDWNKIQAGTREASWNMEGERVNARTVEEKRELPFEKRDKKYKEFRGNN